MVHACSFPVPHLSAGSSGGGRDAVISGMLFDSVQHNGESALDPDPREALFADSHRHGSKGACGVQRKAFEDIGRGNSDRLRRSAVAVLACTTPPGEGGGGTRRRFHSIDFECYSFVERVISWLGKPRTKEPPLGSLL